MSKTIKIIIGVSSALLLILVVLGAYFFLIPRGKKDAELPKFRFSTNSWVGSGPMYLAKEKGFFKDEGVDVEISVMEDQAQRTAAMTKGEIDGYIDTADLLVTTRANNVPAISVMQIDFSDGADGIIVTSNIKKAQDLKGKKIAVQRNFVGESFLIYYLQQNGMTVSDVEMVDMESGAAGSAFAAGSIDAAVTFEPWLSKA
jgi:NitT/TauT family transport system substrate-binding protein